MTITKINKARSLALAAILSSVVILSACTSTTPTTDTTSPDIAPDDAQQSTTTPESTNSVQAVDPISAAEQEKAFTIESGNFKFSQTELKVKKGDKVKITLNNKDGFHDFVLDEFNAKTKQLKAGETETIEFTADKAGTFEYYCGVGQHRQMGMVGKLIVE